nr:hypothetical protein [Tanacetum cinerariifolium]
VVGNYGGDEVVLVAVVVSMVAVTVGGEGDEIMEAAVVLWQWYGEMRRQRWCSGDVAAAVMGWGRRRGEDGFSDDCDKDVGYGGSGGGGAGGEVNGEWGRVTW